MSVGLGMGSVSLKCIIVVQAVRCCSSEFCHSFLKNTIVKQFSGFLKRTMNVSSLNHLLRVFRIDRLITPFETKASIFLSGGFKDFCKGLHKSLPVVS